jgi:SAM-dependent methyltransferase
MSRRHAPATLRNRDPILAVLRRVLPRAGTVLEIGSGSGEHAAYFATALAPLRWQPSDRTPRDFASIAAWAGEAGATTVEAALVLDAEADSWPVQQVDAVFSANVTHIAPWHVTQGLLRGAGRVLPDGAPVVLYGPFMRDGRHTALSNAAFDTELRAQDPSWGIRDLGAVIDEAARHGLVLDEVVEMPANNLTLVLRRQSSSGAGPPSSSS